jgi:hypothetical protein
MAVYGAEAFPEIAALDPALTTARDNVLKYVQVALDQMNVLGLAYTGSVSAFEQREAAYKLELDAAVQARTAHKQLLEDNAKLTAELKDAEAVELQIGEQEQIQQGRAEAVQ